MDFKARLFLSSSLVIGLFMCNVFAGESTKCTDGTAANMAGKYKLTSKCYACPPGCYCPGSTTALDPKGNKKPDIYDSDVDKWCSGAAQCKWPGGWGECGDSGTSTQPKARVMRCPSEFPHSELWSSVISQCYAKVGSNKLYYIDVECKPGQYLPKGWSSCSACTGSREYCPGGKLLPSPSKAVGLKECSSNQIANSSHTGCESANVTCKAGQYLPKNATECRSCKTGRYYVCEGGSFQKKPSSDLGIRRCDANLIANDEHTACITDTSTSNAGKTSSGTSIHAEPGFYLPANKTEPVSCSGAKRYCPGGDYDVRSVDQGIFDCPLNGRANASKSACTVTLTKDQMRFGPLGSSTVYSRQCWLKTSNADEFRSCIFGIRSKNDSE